VLEEIETQGPVCCPLPVDHVFLNGVGSFGSSVSA